SLAHPGGNVTGLFLDFSDFSAKSLQLLTEAIRLAPLLRPCSGVDIDQFFVRRSDGLFRRHALHCLGVHVADQVFGNDLGSLAARWAGIPGKTAALRRGAERRHDRVVLPQLMFLPHLGWTDREALLGDEPLIVDRFRVEPAQEILGSLL